MNKKLKKELVDQSLHVVVPLAALTPALAFPRVWTFMISLFILAVYREDASHRKEDGRGWIFMGSLFGRRMDIFFGTLAGIPAYYIWRAFL